MGELLLTLYDGERIYNLAFHFAGSAADAEDLTPEIFLRLYQNLRLYRGDVPLAAWALRLSRNLCVENSSRRSRRERRAGVTAEEVLAAMPAGGDDPQAQAQRRRRLRTVYRELEAIRKGSPRWCCCATSRGGARRRPRLGWRYRSGQSSLASIVAAWSSPAA